MKEELSRQLTSAAAKLFKVDEAAELSRPAIRFGDYSTNLALKIAATSGKPPREIAEALAKELNKHLDANVSRIEIAGPGFINLYLSDAALIKAAAQRPKQVYESQQVIVEFGDPNPFKTMHLGHLYTAVVGDSIARLFEATGADVKRVRYHGDIGLHIAKAIWAIQKKLSSAPLKELLSSDEAIGQFYAAGAKAYEDNSEAKAEIEALNAELYKADNLKLQEIYELGLEISFKHFDQVFKELDIKFVKKYLESQAGPVGLELVKENMGRVFTKSRGAVIYDGEKAGLHTRVFINSRGLPTYETKDLGLAVLKDQDFPKAQKSVVVTDHQQADYFNVMLAALSQIKPKLAKKTEHLYHGHLGLATGKMSSRTGQVVAGTDLIEAVKAAVKTQFPDSKEQAAVYLAAVRYSFLKNRLGADIVFDVKESVALEGNSGPYLQYAQARARSILAKAADVALVADAVLEPQERQLLSKLSQYGEVVDQALNERRPHHVAVYLYELAQAFNSFYEKNRVINDPRQALRLGLVRRYADTLTAGLRLLGIPAPDKM